MFIKVSLDRLDVVIVFSDLSLQLCDFNVSLIIFNLVNLFQHFLEGLRVEEVLELVFYFACGSSVGF